MQLQAGLSTADVLVTTNKILNYTASFIANIITLLFYIVFSPFICLLMLIYPTKEEGEPEELRRLSMVSVAEEEDDENPFQQSEESKEIQRKIKNIRF